ncbi:MAG: peptidylprolyl isomerase [Acidobacteriota bacterium]|nr:peptidylprolyl isomerase [Acidobacteriota bacterium]
MKSCLLLSAVLCASVAFAQGTSTPAPSSQSTPPPPTTQLRVRGPEAVAQSEPNKVVATIDGKPVTAKEAAALLKGIPADQLKKYESNLANVVQQIYMTHQLADQAVKMNLDQQSPWKEQLQLNHDSILTQAYLNKVASTSSIPATDPQQYYNAHPQEFDRVKLSGIFIGFNPPGTPAASTSNNRTEEQARAKADDIEKKLKAGSDFSTLARTESDNQQSAARGGEIGTFSVADPQLPAELKTAMEKLQPGQSSEPIRIPNSLLVIKVDSRNKLTLEQARPEIVQKLQNEHNQAAVKQEIDKYKIQVQDPDFFNASGAAPASNVPSLQRPTPAAAQPRAATPPQH